MKAMFYICMTSGIQGPEAELTEEFSKEISDLALQLDKPWVGPKLTGISRLGIDQYIVSWEDENAPVRSLRTDASGYVGLWKKDSTDWQEFRDTVDLWARLAPTGGRAYQKWWEDPYTQKDPNKKILKLL